MEKHKERINFFEIKVINSITLLLGFATALTTYIISSYFKEVTGSDNVTFFYLISYLIILVALINLHKIIKFAGEKKIFNLSLIIFLLSSLPLVFLPIGIIGIIVLIINLIASTLCFAEKDALLESCSIDKMSGRIRGLHLTLMNLGFLLAPFISSQLLSKYSYSAVFLLQCFIIFSTLLLSIFGLKNKNYAIAPSSSIKNVFKKISEQRDILRIYYISFVLDIFYFFAVVFVPIHLLNLGMDWQKIGFVFTIMLLPFVLIQYPIGLLADKKMGEKEMLIISLFILAISGFSLYYINSISIIIWSIALFITRIGAASLEMLRDSYFYKKIDGNDVDLINFFRTTNPVAYIIGSSIAAFLLTSFSVSSVFILILLFSLSGLIPAFKLKDNKSEVEELTQEA